MSKKVRLQLLPGAYAVSRLDVGDKIPDWADGDGFVSISRGGGELSIVCLEGRVPAGTMSSAGWTAMRFLGPFAFDETGIVLAVVKPLTEGGIGVFVVSTFDEDHMLLKTADLPSAGELLTKAGHQLLAV